MKTTSCCKYVNMGTEQVIDAFENSLRQREREETLKKEREQKSELGKC
jgi:hypothetical protein